MTAPAIILVNTQMPENIGAAARAMKNFGLSDLRLVAPRDEFPNKRAYDLASHAADILESARVYVTTQEAIAGLQRIYASTARSREMVKAVYTPSDAMEVIARENVPCGVLFGPERTGLVNEDIALADSIITIPTAAMASINVAQSVVIMAYQWFQNAYGVPFESGSLVHKSDLATKDELQGFLNHLERRLDEVDFWKVYEKKQKMWINLQNIFTRASLTEQEVRTLHGVIASFKD